MGVSRSRDDYRLGKPILHARYLPPPPPLLYGRSALSIISFLSPFFLSPPSFSSTRHSLSISLPQSIFVPSLSKPTALGLIRDRSQEEDRYLHFLRTNRAFLPLRLRPLVGERKFLEEKERERDRGQACHTRTLSPKLDTIERTSIPSVITFVSLMPARPPAYLSLRSRAWIRSSIDLHPARSFVSTDSSLKHRDILRSFFSLRYCNITSFRFFRLGAYKMADF